jgi:hypothetical protein
VTRYAMFKHPFDFRNPRMKDFPQVGGPKRRP